MKKLFLLLCLAIGLNAHAGYNYGWALEQQFTVCSSVNQLHNINYLMSKLRADGNWTTLDALWVPAVETQQQAVFNWKNPGTYTLTEVNSPTWTAKQGYTGNASTMYLNTNFNPTSHGVNYTLNNASFGVYNRTSSAIAGMDMGATTAGAKCEFWSKWTDNKSYVQVHGNSVTVYASQASATSSGLISAIRSSSSTMSVARNGSITASAVLTSTAVPNTNFFILCTSSTGTPTLFSSRQVSVAYIGSDAVVGTNLFNAIEAYLDYIGAGVI